MDGAGRRWLLTLAVLWPLIYVIFGVAGDFDGATVARSFLVALAVTAGLALGRRRGAGAG
jgi:hypothetical protein